eukprot:4305243-Prymnesium_polylepis.1
MLAARACKSTGRSARRQSGAVAVSSLGRNVMAEGMTVPFREARTHPSRCSAAPSTARCRPRVWACGLFGHNHLGVALVELFGGRNPGGISGQGLISESWRNVCHGRVKSARQRMCGR